MSGAVKVASLAGALFNHKDDKKGHHDIFQIFFESSLGYIFSFPDTSNTRYQSYCLAACALNVHLPLYISFLELIQDKKDSGLFNHMEQNVYKALHDIPTLTELCVLALYSISISAPYMRQVRGPEHDTTNVLNLGPLHKKVKAHCQAIIDHPDLLLAPDASYEDGSMDGMIWHQPEVFYAVHQLIPQLPHLREALIEFFEGALDKWKRFSSEFAPGSTIATASSEKHAQAFMRATNDKNEGALGSFQVQTRYRPSMTLPQHNAHAMYKKNGIKSYMCTLTPAQCKWIHKKTHSLDSSGQEKKRRQAQAKADKITSDQNRKRKQLLQAKKDAAKAKREAVVPRLDVNDIKNAPGTNAHLDLQLDWHRSKDSTGSIPKKKDLTNKELKVKALTEAVTRHNMANQHSIMTGQPSGSIIDVFHEEEVETDEDLEEDDFNMEF
jgi:hypothetical protein